VSERVLEDAGVATPLVIPRQKGETELAVKEIKLAGRRYIVCRNEEKARKDAENLTDLNIIEVEQDARRALLRTAPRVIIDPICRAVEWLCHPYSRRYYRARRSRTNPDAWCLKIGHSRQSIELPLYFLDRRGSWA
jgi:hypothetical protein